MASKSHKRTSGCEDDVEHMPDVFAVFFYMKINGFVIGMFWSVITAPVLLQTGRFSISFLKNCKYLNGEIPNAGLIDFMLTQHQIPICIFFR